MWTGMDDYIRHPHAAVTCTASNPLFPSGRGTAVCLLRMRSVSEHSSARDSSSSLKLDDLAAADAMSLSRPPAVVIGPGRVGRAISNFYKPAAPLISRGQQLPSELTVSV